jgi:DNA adenine methylase
VARPVLKWAGGKGQLLPAILARLPYSIGRYYEPFAGGAAVFFAVVEAGIPERAVLGDQNGELLNVYRCLAAGPASVAAALSLLISEFEQRDGTGRRSFFYELRSGSSGTLPEVAARTIFLNRTCYNGLYRVNSRGEFNVPYGRYKQPSFPPQQALEEASAALQQAEIRGPADFTEVVSTARAGDFVYFDPPYAPLSATASFTSYTSGGFGAEGQRRLLEECVRLTRLGVRFLLSNSSGDDVGALYAGEGFHVERIPARRAINSNGARRGPVEELLVSNSNLVRE